MDKKEPNELTIDTFVKTDSGIDIVVCNSVDDFFEKVNL